jgi:hypothetical protein
MGDRATRTCPTCGNTAWADAKGCAYCKTSFTGLPPSTQPVLNLPPPPPAGIDPNRLPMTPRRVAEATGIGLAVLLAVSAVSLGAALLMDSMGFSTYVGVLAGAFAGPYVRRMRYLKAYAVTGVLLFIANIGITALMLVLWAISGA